MSGDRIRILNVVNNFCRGGTEGQAITTALALDPARFDVRCACSGNGGELAATAAARLSEIREYPVNGFRSAGYLGQVARLARDLRRGRIEIVHSYGFYCHMLAIPAARLAGVEVVVASIRDCGVYLTPGQQRAQRFLCGLADCVLTNATAVKTWLVDGGGDPARIAIIHNGVDLSQFTAPAAGGARPHPRIREEFGFEDTCPLVVVVARLSRTKGINYLIEAAPTILARRPDTRFLLVGPDDWGNQAKLADRVRALGLDRAIRFSGDRTDVPAILADATVSVLPSLSEAMPNGVLESMAAGVPVVATRVGGIPEAIEDGRNGLLVPPANAPALAEAISRLLDAPAEAARLGRAGRETIEERFSLEQMVRSTTNLYVDLLARKRRVPTPSSFAAPRKVG
jgi:glycosyltransferase involved in cell wall biosynthesis